MDSRSILLAFALASLAGCFGNGATTTQTDNGDASPESDGAPGPNDATTTAPTDATATGPDDATLPSTDAPATVTDAPVTTVDASNPDATVAPDAGTADAGGEGSASDATGPSGPVAACGDPEAEAGPTNPSTAGEGCADGTREGFTDGATFPDVAVCAGVWTGTVDQAQGLCAGGWHVCMGTEPAFAAVTYDQATAFCGCFAVDDAQDNYSCHPGCVAAVNQGVDTAQNIDRGGVGATCAWSYPGAGSCMTGGRIDSSENSGTGCNYDPSIAGVVCCRDSM